MKQRVRNFEIEDSLSHPEWVRGLKPKYKKGIGYVGKSHPEWVRGLKHESSVIR